MADIKDLLLELDETSAASPDGAVEVYADSVKQALDLAARELGRDVTELDYEVLEKGTSGFFGIGRQPYHILIIPSSGPEEDADLEELEHKLTKTDHGIPEGADHKNADGSFVVKVLRSGIWLTVNPAKGKGRAVTDADVNNRLYGMKITPDDPSLVEKTVKKASGKPVKIGAWKLNPDYDSTMNIEITDDLMKVYIHFVPPRYNGRHPDPEEVVEVLKNAGVVIGIKEKEIHEYLDRIEYTQPLLAAEGEKPRHGKDAYVEYKVRVERGPVSFEEDEKGNVDFKNLNLFENVTQGQTLAVKVPPEQGIPGRTVTNMILPAKSGKDIKMPYGKGTMISEDGTEIIAATNGHVIFKNNKLSVDDVIVINGDVSLQSGGNINTLGSVVIKGNVQDNFEVKAGGNIEIMGNVGKAYIEAEGDILVFQVIAGGGGGKVESTNGNVLARSIQEATVIAEKDVVAPEGIVRSRVEAGRMICVNGKKAAIKAGEVRAGVEINAKFLGSESDKTIVRVGIHPKRLQQIQDLEEMKVKLTDEQIQLRQNIKTLERQKIHAAFSEEKEKMYQESVTREQKITARLDEIQGELDEQQNYIRMSENVGKVNVEKTTTPGVDIFLRNELFEVRGVPYSAAKFFLKGNRPDIGQYEPPQGVDGRIMYTMKRRR